ncbi:sortase [Candidatus Daviesbacteria bacterium]|nr:sortase [Candidatus Daviesbacteria bacterium]
MQRSELPLQIFVFGMTACLVSLLVVKIYPSKIFALSTAENTKLVSPVVYSYTDSKISSPEKIIIPSLLIDLPIAEGVISDNKWTLFEDKVSWLSTSKPAGFGNVILYAHNKEQLLGKLKNIKLGEEIKIIQEGKTYFYIVSEKKKISPEDIDAILTERDQLTIYTCDGSFDQRRLVVVALPKA